MWCLKPTFTQEEHISGVSAFPQIGYSFGNGFGTVCCALPTLSLHRKKQGGVLQAVSQDNG
jgi:hypothetical protein